MDKKPEDGSIYYFGADDLRFKRPAVPGDKLILNSKVLTNKKGIWKSNICNEDDLVAKQLYFVQIDQNNYDPFLFYY